jgi:pimeloyl-ACP methyl ester carboxylesterase
MSALARFSWTPFLCNPKLERRLGRITARTLVACPSDDRLVPVAHGQRYAERIGGARYAEVPDCGHAMYFERPAEFADLVTSFLSGASR